MEKYDTEEIEVNADGGKNSKIDEWPTELPPFALMEIAAVMKAGAQKYGSHNWHAIPVKQELDHAIRHYFRFMMGCHNPPMDYQWLTEELAHFATRALMALDQWLRDCQVQEDDGPEDIDDEVLPCASV